jgi:hypothetical protein
VDQGAIGMLAANRLRALHDQSDIPEIMRLSAAHEVNFLPPEASD